MTGEVRLVWDGDEVAVPAGITVAAAGFLAGRRVLQRSRSLREPRGYFCGIGRCFGCAMEIDGAGRALACLHRVYEGMRVATLDGDPSTPTIEASQAAHGQGGAAPEVLSVDVLVVGGGAAGRAALAAAAQAGARVAGVTAGVAGRGGGQAAPDFPDFRRGTVWGDFDRGREWAVWTGDGVLAIRAPTVVIATGASEAGLPIRHGTRPGVMTATAMRLLLEQGVAPGARPFLYGEEPFLGRAAADCRRHGVAPAGTAVTASVRVLDVRGGDGVTAVVTSAGEVEADALVFCTPPQPHLELVQAAGADLYWDEAVGAHVPAFDRSLQTSVAGLFVAGGVAGAHTAEQATLQGHIAGRAAAVAATGAPLPAADWDPVLQAARAFGAEAVEPRAWAARAGRRRIAADQWLRDGG